MQKIIILKVLFLSILTPSVGCVAFSRMAEPHTARTLGEDNNEVELSVDGFHAPTFSQSLEYTRGISDNFDLAVFVEIQGLFFLLIGLEGKYQLVGKEKHVLSLLFGAGINKGLDDDNFFGYFGYLGPVYSFKPNKKYELALNVRVNQSYFQTINHPPVFGEITAMPARVLLEGLGADIDDAEWSALFEDSTPVKSSFLYGSANMSHTWWIVPSFGATLSLGVIYPVFILSREGLFTEGDEISSTAFSFKSGLNVHFNF